VIRYVNVPFNSAGFSTGVARMPASLGFEGITVPVSVDPSRGVHGLIAEPGLGRMVADVEKVVRETFIAGDIPVLIGGDCPIMLGALRAIDDPGLVFIDGHEDAWQPTPDVRGEASDSELGIAIGTVRSPVMPMVSPERVVALGPRDADEITQFGQERVDHLVLMRDDVWVNNASVDELVATAAAATASSWWLHVDLDVLSTDALAAVDYPQPGGLSWQTLQHVTDTLIGTTGCRGASVVVYNPDLDEGASSPRIAAFIRRLSEKLADAQQLEGARP